MRFCVLGSGSRGNATFVETGRTRLLIDAGFSGKEIEKRLAAIEVEAATLDGILITHEHGDHIKGAAILSRRYQLPVLANNATLAAAGEVMTKLHALHEFTTGTSFAFKDFTIHPYRISHDAADPVGFILTGGSQVSMGYCTDTGVVSRLMQHRLAGCHGLVLECNHDLELLRTGPYPLPLQQRVRSKIGHLANEDAASFLREILSEDLQHVVLSHISETNNRPDLAHATVQAMLDEIRSRTGESALLPNLSLAYQDRVGELVTLTRGRG